MRYPKLHYFNGSAMQYHRVNRLPNYFIRKCLNEGRVFIEGELGKQIIPGKVMNGLERVAFKRRVSW